jgi:hypothetical protein
VRAGGALGRLLPWPLLPAAALVDGPPPAPPLPALALPLPFLRCGAPHPPRQAVSGETLTRATETTHRSPPNCTLWSPM